MIDEPMASGEQDNGPKRATAGEAGREPTVSSLASSDTPKTSPADKAPEGAAVPPPGLTEEERLAREVERLNGELAQMKDKYLRAMAEMDNMRRRNDKEKRDLLQFGQERLIKDLLPVLDSCDKAVAGGDGTVGQNGSESVIDGIKLVFKQLVTALERHGLKAVESVDKLFDPNVHQAISRQEIAGLEHDKVIVECGKGYLLHERLVRPAMVVVGVAAEPKCPPEPAGNQPPTQGHR